MKANVKSSLWVVAAAFIVFAGSCTIPCEKEVVCSTLTVKKILLRDSIGHVLSDSLIDTKVICSQADWRVDGNYRNAKNEFWETYGNDTSVYIEQTDSLLSLEKMKCVECKTPDGFYCRRYM